jgi:hypothetical protein
MGLSSENPRTAAKSDNAELVEHSENDSLGFNFVVMQER